MSILRKLAIGFIYFQRVLAIYYLACRWDSPRYLTYPAWPMIYVVVLYEVLRLINAKQSVSPWSPYTLVKSSQTQSLEGDITPPWIKTFGAYRYIEIRHKLEINVSNLVEVNMSKLTTCSSIFPIAKSIYIWDIQEKPLFTWVILKLLPLQ